MASPRMNKSQQKNKGFVYFLRNSLNISNVQIPAFLSDSLPTRENNGSRKSCSHKRNIFSFERRRRSLIELNSSRKTKSKERMHRTVSESVVNHERHLLTSTKSEASCVPSVKTQRNSVHEWSDVESTSELVLNLPEHARNHQQDISSKPCQQTLLQNKSCAAPEYSEDESESINKSKTALDNMVQVIDNAEIIFNKINSQCNKFVSPNDTEEQLRDDSCGKRNIIDFKKKMEYKYISPYK